MHLILGLFILLLGNPHALLPAATPTAAESKEEKATAEIVCSVAVTSHDKTLVTLPAALVNHLQTLKNICLKQSTSAETVLKYPLEESLIKHIPTITERINQWTNLIDIFYTHPSDFQKNIDILSATDFINFYHWCAFLGAKEMVDYFFKDTPPLFITLLVKKVSAKELESVITTLMKNPFILNEAQKKMLSDGIMGTIYPFTQDTKLEINPNDQIAWSSQNIIAIHKPSSPTVELFTAENNIITPLTTITHEGFKAAFAVVWSNDGTVLAVQSDIDIVLVHNNKKAWAILQSITVRDSALKKTKVVWAPDDTKFVCSQNDFIHLFGKDLQGRWFTEQLHSKKGLGKIAWSPNNTTLAALTSHESSVIFFNITKTKIALMSVTIPATSINHSIEDILWNNDGSKIAYVEHDKTLNKVYTVIMNKKSNGTYELHKKFTFDLSVPSYSCRASWSPDGNFIALNTQLVGSEAYMTTVLTMNDSSQKTLSVIPQDCVLFKWSPDSALLYSIHKGVPLIKVHVITPVITIGSLSNNQLILMNLVQQLKKTGKENREIIKKSFNEFPPSVQTYVNELLTPATTTSEPHPSPSTPTSAESKEEKQTAARAEESVPSGGLDMPEGGSCEVQVTLNGKKIMTLPEPLVAHLKAVKEVCSEAEHNFKLDNTSIAKLIPDIGTKIARYIRILGTFYFESDKKSFDTDIKALSYIDLIQFYQMCTYFNADGIENYFFEPTSAPFIHWLLEKTDTIDLQLMLNPLTQNTGAATISTGDVLLAGATKKTVLINQLNETNRSFVFNKRASYNPSKDQIRSGTWSNDNTIAFISRRGSAHIYSLHDGTMKLSQTITDPTFDSTLSYNTPGTLLASIVGSSVQLWQKNNLQWDKGQLLTLPHMSGETGLSFSPDNTMLALVQRTQLVLWVKNSESNIWELQKSTTYLRDALKGNSTHLSYQLAWSPNNSTLAILSPNSTLYIYTKKEREFFIRYTFKTVTAIAWHPDGEILAYLQDGIFTFANLQRSQYILTVSTGLSRDSGRSSLLVWSPNGKMIAVYGETDTGTQPLRVLNINDTSWINIDSDNPKIKYLKWSPDSATLYALKNANTEDSLISYVIDPLPHLKDCSVNQLLILLILKHMVETPDGQKKTTENLPLIKQVFASFPTELQPHLLDRFTLFTLPKKAPVSPPPPVAAVTDTPAIKQGLKNLAHNLNYLSRTLRA